MILYIFEDNQTTSQNMYHVAEGAGFTIKTADNLPAALARVAEIQDDDIVSLDAQMPNPDEGIKIAEAIRDAGIKCLILWHSTLPAPDEKQLGIYTCSLPSNEWIINMRIYQHEWENIRQAYQYHKKNKFCSLRSQILMPFASLHLALIDSFDENDNVKFKPLIFDVECKKIFNELKAEDEKDKYKIESRLKELLDKAGEKFKDRDKLLCSSIEECKSKSCVFHKLMDRIVGLCQVVADRNTNKLVSFSDLYEGHKNSNGMIGEFAEMLEDVAEHIERTN